MSETRCFYPYGSRMPYKNGRMQIRMTKYDPGYDRMYVRLKFYGPREAIPIGDRFILKEVIGSDTIRLYFVDDELGWKMPMWNNSDASMEKMLTLHDFFNLELNSFSPDLSTPVEYELQNDKEGCFIESKIKLNIDEGDE